MNLFSFQRYLWVFFMLFPALWGNSQRLEVYLDYKRFTSPDNKGLLEVYLQVNSLSTQLLADEQKRYFAKVEITEIIKKGDVIVDFSKRIVESEHMVDSLIVDFMDQQRFSLEPGNYEMELLVTDLHLDTLNKIESIIPLIIKTDTTKIALSDIQPVESFIKADSVGRLTKSGFDIIPYVSNYYPPDIEKIAFYAEIYNSLILGADEKFAMFQYIEDTKTGKSLNEFTRFSKLTAKKIIPVLGAIDIKKLPPGNYNLVIELRDKENQFITNVKWNFQRNNIILFNMEDILSLDIKATFVEKMVVEDSINEYISSMRPIAQPNEMIVIDSIVRRSNLKAKQQFMYSFWSARDGMNPEYAWMDYKRAVDNVNGMFSTQIKRGYMTDRGAIFLKYGAPDYVYDRANEPSNYPYQIWQYKKVGKYNNKRFIFYMPDLVTNDYMLLHSEIPGEVKNYRWRQVIGARNNTNTNVDDGSTPNQWGNNANQLYKNPR